MAKSCEVALPDNGIWADFSGNGVIRQVSFGMASYSLRIIGVGGGQQRADHLRQLREALVLG
jgi:hypothetical protein